MTHEAQNGEEDTENRQRSTDARHAGVATVVRSKQAPEQEEVPEAGKASVARRLLNAEYTTDVLSATQFAKLIDKKTNQVFMWSQRRDKNGFPSPVASVHKSFTGGRRGAPLYDTQELITWFLNYDARAMSGKHWAAKREAGLPSGIKSRTN